jgi:hypothetical protein
MFTSSKVSKSLLDAVNLVTENKDDCVTKPEAKGIAKGEVKKHEKKMHGEEVESVEEGLGDTVKKVAKAGMKALTGGSDQDQLKRLQKNMGIPQTGKPAHAKQNEEVEKLEELFDDLPNAGMTGDHKGPFGVYHRHGPDHGDLKIVSKHKTLKSALKHVDRLEKKTGKEHVYGNLLTHQPEHGKISQSLIDAVNSVDEAWPGTPEYKAKYDDKYKQQQGGGAGVKKGHAYGGANQKSKPEHDETPKKEEVQFTFKDRLLEREMTKKEKSKRHEIAGAMEQDPSYFKKKYGARWKEVMNATATKKAMGEELGTDGLPIQEAEIATDMLKGRVEGEGKSNSFKNFKVKIEGGLEKGKVPDPEEVAKNSTTARASVTAHGTESPQPGIGVQGHEQVHFNKNQGFAEETVKEASDTTTKDKSGKVTSWKHEGDWTKSNKKNPEGKVHNLAGQALKKTKELNKEEVESLDEGKMDHMSLTHLWHRHAHHTYGADQGWGGGDGGKHSHHAATAIENHVRKHYGNKVADDMVAHSDNHVAHAEYVGGAEAKQVVKSAEKLRKKHGIKGDLYGHNEEPVKEEYVTEAKDPSMDAGVGAAPNFVTPENTTSSPVMKKIKEVTKTAMGRVKNEMLGKAPGNN